MYTHTHVHAYTQTPFTHAHAHRHAHAHTHTRAGAHTHIRTHARTHTHTHTHLALCNGVSIGRGEREGGVFFNKSKRLCLPRNPRTGVPKPFLLATLLPRQTGSCWRLVSEVSKIDQWVSSLVPRSGSYSEPAVCQLTTDRVTLLADKWRTIGRTQAVCRTAIGERSR